MQTFRAVRKEKHISFMKMLVANTTAKLLNINSCSSGEETLQSLMEFLSNDLNIIRFIDFFKKELVEDIAESVIKDDEALETISSFISNDVLAGGILRYSALHGMDVGIEWDVDYRAVWLDGMVTRSSLLSLVNVNIILWDENGEVEKKIPYITAEIKDAIYMPFISNQMNTNIRYRVHSLNIETEKKDGRN